MIAQALMNILNPTCLLLICLGVCVGIIFGSIPGLSATMAVVLFLPLSFGLEPANGISLLIGLYMGGISGGLISAILLKIPGTPSSIATVLDGGPMADKGEAGKALGAGILYSAIGSLISIVALIYISPYLAALTLKFTPVEYFAIAIFSLSIIASLSGDSLVKGLLAGLLGIGFSLVGMAPIDAISRFTFGSFELMGGFNIIVLLVGVFAVTDIIMAGLGRKHLDDAYQKKPYHLKGFGVTLREFKEQFGNMIRSSLIGIGIGILPGIGGNVAGLLSYTATKNASKYPEKFGTGIVDGVIASETSNNAVIGGSLIPLLTMGIPGNTVAAVLLGGLTIHGINPGPLIFQKSGVYVYGIFFALIVATLAMLVFERGALPIFVKLLDVPKHILLPIVMVCCAVGAFSSSSRVFDIWCILGFGFLGVVMKYFKIPSTPLIIGFILGPMTEENLRRALQASAGKISVFFTRPISLGFLVAGFLFVAYILYNKYKNNGENTLGEKE
ncbi:tripartite tricarboxylate transporter permease [Acidaminococcus fermentans]|uniref:tripartite tricarboxylate transporter permease n=1 Tax=Acidaminococcus fermentans TaxID=905 RepID=UPI002E76A3D7|nr:tripartite tricarboxylate transporter permease [Acidaminococcus fermentans]MEE0339169.1 tripartite tricarboxylate transporter permease [Acidaminococcus fermentans]